MHLTRQRMRQNLSFGGVMASFSSLSLMARIAYYSKSIMAHVLSVILEKRHVAVFMFIRKTETVPEFLQIFHKYWGCYLFPGAQINPDDSSENWISERCGGKVGLTTSTKVTFEHLVPQRLENFDLVSVKQSGSDLKRRVYFYKFYLVKLPNSEKWPAFERIVAACPGIRWMTYNDLVNDRIAYIKNGDVIDHLAFKMNKGYGFSNSAQ